jgi:hypothetical protein
LDTLQFGLFYDERNWIELNHHHPTYSSSRVESAVRQSLYPDLASHAGTPHNPYHLSLPFLKASAANALKTQAVIMRLMRELFFTFAVVLLLVQLVLAAEDYYKILGLDKGASEKDIRRAYRTLSKKFHPDKNP